jgi:hypothetical protein
MRMAKLVALVAAGARSCGARSCMCELLFIAYPSEAPFRDLPLLTIATALL